MNKAIARGLKPLQFVTGGFVDSDTRPGLILLSAAILAVVLANSMLAPVYDSALSTPVTVAIGEFVIDKPLLLWINDGLMAVFFFLVGLEIKRELVEGELSTWQTAALPALAAVGGMLFPALIYLGLNAGDPQTMNGWAIPAATDIAFALGVLALLGARVPTALKVFLLALAILDDLGAIVIIAAFYTADLSVASLAIGAIGASILLAMNLLGVQRPSLYILVGVFIWAAVLKSGVHATLAGVVAALMVPMRGRGSTQGPLVTLEHALKPWVAYLIMPAFAFANAGVTLGGLSIADLAGIGFTMSLFIGTLAFSDPETTNAVRLGVLSGSVLSGLAGYLVLRSAIGASQPSGRVGTPQAAT